MHEGLAPVRPEALTGLAGPPLPDAEPERALSVFSLLEMDPILAQVRPLAIRRYGLFFAAAFLVGFQIMAWIYQHEGADPASLDRLLVYMPIGDISPSRIAGSP